MKILWKTQAVSTFLNFEYFRLAIRYIRDLQALLEIPIEPNFDSDKPDPAYWVAPYYGSPEADAFICNPNVQRQDSGIFLESENYFYAGHGDGTWKDGTWDTYPYVSISLGS